MTRLECEHGSLARSCQICDLQKDIIELRVDFERADPEQLAKFDPRTKACTMNCGPCSGDPRSAAERKFLCDDCEPAQPAEAARPASSVPDGWRLVPYTPTVLMLERAEYAVNNRPQPSKYEPSATPAIIFWTAMLNYAPEAPQDANPATVLALLDDLARTQGSLAIASAALSAAERKLQSLRAIEAAARNLAKVKGRHNSEQAMNQLLEALK